MPTNAKMSQLKDAFESAGFADVKTVLGSGNVVFSARSTSLASLQSKAQGAMLKRLGREFLTIVRPVDALRELLASDPYEGARLPPAAKRIVTFLREPPARSVDLPIEFEGARIVSMTTGEVFSAYLPNPKGPSFMTLIEKTFGKEQTTRTWGTVAKVAR